MEGQMQRYARRICAVLALFIVMQAPMGQTPPDRMGHRVQGGGINYAPLPAIYTVVAVDWYDRRVTLRDDDGRTAEVRVPEGVHDLDELNEGDRIQVDFFLADGDRQDPSAARIWPVR